MVVVEVEEDILAGIVFILEDGEIPQENKTELSVINIKMLVVSVFTFTVLFILILKFVFILMRCLNLSDWKLYNYTGSA